MFGAVAAAQLLGVAGKILAAVAQPFSIDGAFHATTCSIGATLFGQASEPVDDIVRRVDAMLYAAKRAGRNTVRLG